MCETGTKLDGKVAIVTGGSSGVGYEAAKNLARRGARVIIASRNETKLKLARDKLQEETGNNDIGYKTMDLGSFKSVRNFVADTTNTENRLDILINNAGAVGLPDVLTEDGLNLTMQVNYFGTFLLTYLLIPFLRKSPPSRIINGSAGSMYIGSVDFEHWNDIGRYSFIESLSNSKLAITLFNVELSKRLNSDEVTANSYDPFVVPDTDVLNQIPSGIRDLADFFIRLVGQPKEEVGAQIAYLAAAPEMKNVTGKHYKFCTDWFNHWLASDDELRRILWDVSKELVKISADEDWETNAIH
ncbi:retinol dehydrogenase 11-like [Leguminivora glycinivorella]|uniref:retinol dehydrogenase 11-like n=1 Tax=Leguminivora glycinivorella TaxID=1035111 RepID=UPI00200E786E|nr:retinol dehydrogenase 11-like [Leguminivora glycinivorella]